METTQSQAYLVIREKSDACRYWADKHGDQFGWSPRIDDAVKFDGKNASRKRARFFSKFDMESQTKIYFCLPRLQWFRCQNGLSLVSRAGGTGLDSGSGSHYSCKRSSKILLVHKRCAKGSKA